MFNACERVAPTRPAHSTHPNEVVDRGAGDLVPCRDARQKSSMGSKQYREFGRGINEQRAAIADLQRRWPKAFPADARDVRPLAGTSIPLIAAELGWSLAYTKGVLSVWKQRRAYCNAVLQYDLRRDLDGAATGAVVGEAGRTMAKARLAVLDAEKRKRIIPQAAKEGAETAPPAPAAEQATAAVPEADTTPEPPPPPPAPRRRPVLTLASMRGASPAQAATAG
jgi:sRNA-binding protein